MSATITPWGRGQLLAAYFNHASFTPPANLYLAYTLTPPVSNDDGSTLDEPAGMTRTALGALSTANWALTGFYEMYNVNQIVPAAPGGPTGVLGGWAICDAAAVATGNCFATGELLEPFSLEAGQAPPPIDIGGIAFGIYD